MRKAIPRLISNPLTQLLRIPGKPASYSRGNRPPSGAKRRWVVIRSVMVAGLARNTQPMAHSEDVLAALAELQKK